jgi:exonuclease III
MKIASWCLANTGESTLCKETICQFNDIDLLVLSGCQDNIMIHPFLYEAGLKYIVEYPAKGQRGMLIAGRSDVLFTSGDQQISKDHIWLEVYLPKHDFKILGFYIPAATDIILKKDFVHYLTQYIEDNKNTKAIIAGNFSMFGDNLETLLNFKRNFQNISAFGWIDAWRYLYPVTYEQSWFSNAKKGLQQDFIILSPLFQEKILNAYHSQIRWGTQNSQQTPRSLIVELM